MAHCLYLHALQPVLATSTAHASQAGFSVTRSIPCYTAHTVHRQDVTLQGCHSWHLCLAECAAAAAPDNLLRAVGQGSAAAAAASTPPQLSR